MYKYIYKAMIVPAVGGIPIIVSVFANTAHQAPKIIESMYKLQKWYQRPIEECTR